VLTRRGGKLGLWEAVSIAVGIIIGAGIFSILGVGAEVAGRNLPLAFIFASAAAVLVAYSYAKLGSKYISNAGPIEFILRGFGDNIFTGTMAFLLWFTYVVSISLFAKAFAGYLLALIGAPLTWIHMSIVEVAIIVVFMLLNFYGARAVGRAEDVIVAVKLGILGVFILAGIWSVRVQWIIPLLDSRHLMGALYAASIFFLTYTGFGLVTNASEDIENPEKNVPRAIYISLVIVTIVYVLIAIVAVGNLPIRELVAAKDYALAEAARPFLGELGFILIGVGALFSTSSAINATLYGGANIAYALAKKGELPRVFERKSWFGEPEGLYITAGLGILFAVFLNLDGIAAVCSATFIIIYLAVIAAHYRLADVTRGNRPLIVVSFIVVAIIFVLLMYHEYVTSPSTFWVIWCTFAVFAAVEVVYRRLTGRVIRYRTEKRPELARYFRRG